MSLLAQPAGIVEVAAVCAAAGRAGATSAHTIPKNRAPPCRVRFDNFFTPGTAVLGRPLRLALFFTAQSSATGQSNWEGLEQAGFHPPFWYTTSVFLGT